MKDRMSAAEYREMANGPKPSKMRNIKTEVDGMIFDSQREANYYCQLKLYKSVGLISDFFMQHSFLIQEGYRKGNKWIKPVYYKADFVVFKPLRTENEYTHLFDVRIKTEVHEVKGRWTEVAKVKRKMFEKRYPEYEMVII